VVLAAWICLALGIVFIGGAIIAYFVFLADEELITTLAIIGVVGLVVSGVLAGINDNNNDNQTRSEIAYSLRQSGYDLDASDIYEDNGTWKAYVVRTTSPYCSGYVSIVVHDGEVVKVSDLVC
jgi:hypothetical protein